MLFDHVGVTTSDLVSGRALLEGSIGVRAWTAEFRDEINEVWVQFGRCDAGMCYELVAPLSPSSPITRVLAKKINVLNHLAYLVDDLPGQAARLLEMGFAQVAEARPAIAYDGRLIQFFVAPSRLMIELIQAPGHRHRYDTPASLGTS
jgi:methylmalonyl-CoA/ethylmalonyl-CoA epimerase